MLSVVALCQGGVHDDLAEDLVDEDTPRVRLRGLLQVASVLQPAQVALAVVVEDLEVALEAVEEVVAGLEVIEVAFEVDLVGEEVVGMAVAAEALATNRMVMARLMELLQALVAHEEVALVVAEEAVMETIDEASGIEDQVVQTLNPSDETDIVTVTVTAMVVGMVAGMIMGHESVVMRATTMTTHDRNEGTEFSTLMGLSKVTFPFFALSV